MCHAVLHCDNGIISKILNWVYEMVAEYDVNLYENMFIADTADINTDPKFYVESNFLVVIV